MTIDRIFGNRGIGPLDKTRTRGQEKKAEQAAPSTGTDRVRFSDTMQQVRQAKEAAGGGEVQRSEKLAALKEQIASGSYRPDTRKVAASLLKFIAEGK